MKKIKYILVLSVAIVMVFALAGCLMDDMAMNEFDRYSSMSDEAVRINVTWRQSTRTDEMDIEGNVAKTTYTKGDVLNFTIDDKESIDSIMNALSAYNALNYYTDEKIKDTDKGLAVIDFECYIEIIDASFNTYTLRAYALQEGKDYFKINDAVYDAINSAAKKVYADEKFDIGNPSGSNAKNVVIIEAPTGDVPSTEGDGAEAPIA